MIEICVIESCIALTFARFARTHFGLTKILEKKSVSQSTQNALKRVKMQKKIFYPF